MVGPDTWRVWAVGEFCTTPDCPSIWRVSTGAKFGISLLELCTWRVEAVGGFLALKCSMHLANFTSWRVVPLKGPGHWARFDSWQVFGSVRGHVILGEMSALAKTSALGRAHLAELLPLGGNSTTSDGCPRLAESAK